MRAGRRAHTEEPNQIKGSSKWKQRNSPQTRNRERKFGPGWIFLIFFVVFTTYVLIQMR